jgi:hypothetical protein
VPTAESPQACRLSYGVLGGLAAVLTAGLLVYSQTSAFAWDEGFHVLAAQLIRHGKRPYLDFMFSQTPLNAYWNAAWMALCGETWHVVHGVAAVMCGLAALLAAGFALAQFPVARWRMAAAVAVALAVGLNELVWQFGTVGQA